MWESRMLDVRMGLSRILRRGCLGSVECLRVRESGFWEVGMDEMEQAHGPAVLVLLRTTQHTLSSKFHIQQQPGNDDYNSYLCKNIFLYTVSCKLTP